MHAALIASDATVFLKMEVATCAHPLTAANQLHFVTFAEEGCESQPLFEQASEISNFFARLECFIGGMCLEF